MARTTLGLIVGNRDVFPAELAIRGREEMLARLKERDIDVVAVSARETSGGVIASWKDAQRCGQLFKENALRIDGILITLPNFGDERAVADSIRLSGLSVPVYVHAFADKVRELSLQQRRDSFCGKLSVCNNLTQYGIPYSLGAAHVLSPDSPGFISEMGWFADVCRVVKGMKRARIGCIGERTTPFKTVRFSEKLLEASGISVETMSLVDIVSKVTALPDSDQRVKAKAAKLSRYLPGSEQVPARSMATSAKLGVALDEWAQDCGIHACAIQCWSAMQEALQIFPCSIMSMMSDELLPSACEADVMGAVAMYALQLAGEGPTSLFDWNNNYDEDPDKLILFHCSNTALSFMKEAAAGLNRMALKSNPKDSCYCTLDGSLKPGPVAFARLATDDTRGRIIGYIGDGEVTTDALSTFGTTGVVKIPQLPKLLSFMAFHGFEHHVALSYSPRTRALREALTRYLGWKIYCHNGEDRSILEQW